MNHPRHFATATPDKPMAIEAATGRSRSFAELELRANRIAHLCRENSLGIGDTIAFLAHDRLEIFDLAWAAQRAGLHYLPVYWQLQTDDAAWMINHADARILFYGAEFAAQAKSIGHILPALTIIAIDGDEPNALEALIAVLPDHPVADEARGMALQYTGGTTGRPKGVRRSIDGAPIDTPDILLPFAVERFGFNVDMRLSTTAPMYHVAPLKLSMIAHALGGTTILLSDFDARRSLVNLEKYKVTHSHWVPHMMVAFSKLPQSFRQTVNLSSHRAAIHAAAPCPPDVKRALIDWWGPIIHEIYAGTEGAGFCMINSTEWLSKPGSVGRSVIAKVHILNTDGSEAAPGDVGEVWFEDGLPFAYHKDTARTAAATNANGWVTMDDLGFLDSDGYLFLRDRKTTMLRLNDTPIYPRVVEDTLISEPEIDDIGIAVLENNLGERHLVAGYAKASDGNDHVLQNTLRARASVLPDMMRPHSYHHLPAFPRDADGKLDRAALAEQLTLAIANQQVPTLRSNP
jgi:long-chain acyl-CoA synthetase